MNTGRGHDLMSRRLPSWAAAAAAVSVVLAGCAAGGSAASPSGMTAAAVMPSQVTATAMAAPPPATQGPSSTFTQAAPRTSPTVAAGSPPPRASTSSRPAAVATAGGPRLPTGTGGVAGSSPRPTTASSPAAVAATSTSRPTSAAARQPSATVSTAPATLAAGGGVVAVDNPKYSLSSPVRTSAEQVAWVFLTYRLSYSWTDLGPGAGVRFAALYATPAKRATMLAGVQKAWTSTWDQVVADRTQSKLVVTKLTTETGGAPTSRVVLTWHSDLTRAGKTNQSFGVTTLTLQRQSDGSWLVSADSFGTAG